MMPEGQKLADTLRLVRSKNAGHSLLLGLVIFFMALTFFAVTSAGTILVENKTFALFFSVLNGLAIGLLFIIGHDACHGSLTGSTILNHIVGRISFLPSLHPFSAWAYSHNTQHHVWTNHAGLDPVYPPASPQEFLSWPRWRQRRERFERSLWGVGVLYLRSIWWAELIIARRARRTRKTGKTWLMDRLLVATYATALLSALYFSAPNAATGCWRILVGFLIPFAVWNWLMGFFTYLHHTNPQTRWYATTAEWTRYRGQVEGTVHVQLPEWLDMSLLRIMQHPAHHVDPGIPLYRLKGCQSQLVATSPTLRFSATEVAAVFQRCLCYDYANHIWVADPYTHAMTEGRGLDMPPITS